MDEQTKQRPDGRRYESHLGEFEETWSQLKPQMLPVGKEMVEVSRSVRESKRQARQYLDVDKLDEGKAPAGQCVLVFYQDNPLHTLRTLLVRARGCPHCRFDCLRTRQGVQSTEKKNGRWGVANVTCTVVCVCEAT